jgi:hypothetical protein
MNVNEANNNKEKKMNRHTRSISNDRLQGESEADINYNSVALRVEDVHKPLQNLNI